MRLQDFHDIYLHTEMFQAVNKIFFIKLPKFLGLESANYGRTSNMDFTSEQL